MSEPDLIPFFMPSLAAVLGNAEQTKGAALTEAEVIAIRDQATCIMMERKDAEQMVVSRGYRDVEPEDCWADWHRLRGQIAGGYLPKLIPCAVGDAHFAARAEALSRGLAAEFEVREHDPAVLESRSQNRSRWEAKFADVPPL